MTKRTHDPLVVKHRLRGLREDIGLTQKEVAEAIHFSVSTIKQYENGYRIPDDDNLKTISSFYNVDPKFILGDTDYKNEVEKMLDRWNKTINIKKIHQGMLFIEYCEEVLNFDFSEFDDCSWEEFLKQCDESILNIYEKIRKEV